MTIALLAKKGGVAKSPLAILLHEAFRQAGKSVAIRDWDAQGTSNKALDLIEGQKAHAETRYEMLIYNTPEARCTKPQGQRSSMQILRWW